MLLELYNLLGQRVETLADRIFPAGMHELEFLPQGQSAPIASGVYFARLTADPTGSMSSLRFHVDQTIKLLYLK